VHAPPVGRTHSPAAATLSPKAAAQHAFGYVLWSHPQTAPGVLARHSSALVGCGAHVPTASSHAAIWQYCRAGQSALLAHVLAVGEADPASPSLVPASVATGGVLGGALVIGGAGAPASLGVPSSMPAVPDATDDGPAGLLHPRDSAMRPPRNCRGSQPKRSIHVGLMHYAHHRPA
jgi:hypothetical protein